MNVHNLTSRPDKPTSGRFVYKGISGKWVWQCDMCPTYETGIEQWSDAVTPAYGPFLPMPEREQPQSLLPPPAWAIGFFRDAPLTPLWFCYGSGVAAFADPMYLVSNNPPKEGDMNENVQQAINVLNRAMERAQWREDGWEVPAIEVRTALDMLTNND